PSVRNLASKLNCQPPSQGGTGGMNQHPNPDTDVARRPPAIPYPLAPGAVLGDTYEVERMIATGGMGELYLCRHRRLPGRFIVKLLSSAFATQVCIDRFRMEAEVVATLRHPNIVQVVDYNVADDGRPYLVMEFIDGQ